jgi:DNA ligase 1
VRGKGKRAEGDDDEDDDEDEDGPPKKKARKPRSKKGGEEDEEDENEGGGAGVPELLLANKWDLEKGVDPTGWWMSEKLDGVRYVASRRLFARRCC